MPSDFIETVYLRVGDVIPELLPQRVFKLFTTPATSGICDKYTKIQNTFVCAPTPIDATTYTLEYKAKWPELTTGAPTNWLITARPDLYLAAVMAEAAGYVRDDERIAMWEGKVTKIIDEMHSQDTRGTHRPGSRMHSNRSGMIV